MNPILGCAWRPRGDVPRFQAIYPRLQQLYQEVVSVPPDIQDADSRALRSLPSITVVVNADKSWCRHTAISKLLDTSATHVHYVDGDRLLRWSEMEPEELAQTAASIHETECLIIGRSEQAMATHARALQQTEQIVNTLFSYLLGQAVDLCGGSRGFSRRAVEFLMANSSPGRPIGTDAEWPVLLHRGGFRIEYRAVNGLAWEVPDHYRSRAVAIEEQHRVADAYDQDASRWAMRVRSAQQIVEAGLAAMSRPLN